MFCPIIIFFQEWASDHLEDGQGQWSRPAGARPTSSCPPLTTGRPLASLIWSIEFFLERMKRYGPEKGPLNWRNWPSASRPRLIWTKEPKVTKLPRICAGIYGKVVQLKNTILRTIELNSRLLVAQLSTVWQTSGTVRESYRGQFKVGQNSAAEVLCQLTGLQTTNSFS